MRADSEGTSLQLLRLQQRSTPVSYTYIPTGISGNAREGRRSVVEAFEFTSTVGAVCHSVQSVDVVLELVIPNQVLTCL